MFALGPDWTFSLVEFLVINGICGFFLYSMDTNINPVLFLSGVLLLLIQNTSFLLTVFLNPGIPPRDMAIHSESYINKVKIFKYATPLTNALDRTCIATSARWFTERDKIRPSIVLIAASA